MWRAVNRPSTTEQGMTICSRLGWNGGESLTMRPSDECLDEDGSELAEDQDSPAGWLAKLLD